MSVRQGISIGMQRSHSDFLLCLKAWGQLDHADYEMIAPMVDSALQVVAHPRVKVLFDATDFLGWDPHTAWEDFTLDLRHRNQFSKIAILGRSNWRDLTSSIASWFMSGEANYFEDRDAALEWLSGHPLERCGLQGELVWFGK